MLQTYLNSLPSQNDKELILIAGEFSLKTKETDELLTVLNIVKLYHY